MLTMQNSYTISDVEIEKATNSWLTALYDSPHDSLRREMLESM